MAKHKIDIFTLPPPPVSLELMVSSPIYARVMADVFKRWFDGPSERTVIEIDDNDLPDSVAELFRGPR